MSGGILGKKKLLLSGLFLNESTSAINSLRLLDVLIRGINYQDLNEMIIKSR